MPVSLKLGTTAGFECCHGNQIFRKFLIFYTSLAKRLISRRRDGFQLLLLWPKGKWNNANAPIVIVH